MTTDQEVLTEVRDHAVWLTINRETRRNAMSAGVLEGLTAGIRQAAADPAVRAVVLTGAGEKACCAGGDI
ncbi:MAG: enoyl-CoA hydratase/isomerase family protein, partial [Ferrovibrionaceae bacterium]